VQQQSDFEFETDIKQGMKGDRAKRVQEFLVHHGFAGAVDGRFGPATRTCVEQFQVSQGLGATGIVDISTFEALVRPFLRVDRPIDAVGQTLGELTVAYARQHLAEHPREIGGERRGPWVRLYMNGHEGADQPWCAAFVRHCLQCACATLGVDLPITFPLGLRPCSGQAFDALARGARCQGLLVEGHARVAAGSLFLVRGKARNSWVHVGIVAKRRKETFSSIEGNADRQGAREGRRDGFEICERVRGFSGKDYIVLDDKPAVAAATGRCSDVVRAPITSAMLANRRA
jgi:Putative peptidoglycan binding domain